ncbi:hypothetical protein [Lacibacter sp.]|uniref:hypothetical protein n=1 Tax=Lacibacter sp. TaxID=1915409 RepID=UPI002B4B0465|nr:hypothetical protein [Lacibacter sp.]HLP39514.1 hypothetical protein [Lacibacter sp.]
MQFIRTITAICLLIGFSLPMLSPVVLQLKQLHVQHEMLEKLEKQQLTSVRVKAAIVQWVKPQKECVLGTEMFDVKKIVVDGDDLVLTGLYDAKEKELKRMIRQQSEQQSKQSKQTVQLLSALALPVEAANVFSYNAGTGIPKNLFRQSFYHPPFLGFLTPPPRSV